MTSGGARIALLRAGILRTSSRQFLRSTTRSWACVTGPELGQCREDRFSAAVAARPLRVKASPLAVVTRRTFCAQAEAQRVKEASDGSAGGRVEEPEAALEKGGDEASGGVAGETECGEASSGDQVSEVPEVPNEGQEERDAQAEAKRRWLCERLGFSEVRSRAVVGNADWMPTRSVEEDFEPKIQWLQERLGVRSEREALKLVADNLLLLRLNVDELESSMEDLRKLVKVNDATMAKMVVTCPKIVVVSLDDVTRRIKWLEERLVLSEANANRVVVSRPLLLAMSIETRLEPTVAWAQSELRLDPHQVGILTLKYPKWMFAITPSGLDLRLRWLQTALACSKEQAARMMSRDGRLWFLGRKNLWPKVVFFREDLGVPPDTLRDALVKCPMIIASNLKTRMRPRVARMAQAGIPFNFEEHQRVISLASDDSFDKWLAEAREVIKMEPDDGA